MRGEKLDEALDILEGLWTGREFSYHGKHYHLDKARFLPTPIQQPRIPIWIGGSWPNTAPLRRAARWDGVIPVKNQATVKLEPSDIPDIMSYVKKYRTSKTPFDIVVIGNGNSEKEIETRRKQYEKQGVTFIMHELIPIVDKEYRADPSRRILVGHSYGGLFAAFALFEAPGLFETLIIGPVSDSRIFKTGR